MYGAPFSTPCASTWTAAMGLPRFWATVGTAGVLMLIGPVLWLWLAAPHPAKRQMAATAEREATVAFLVAGYEPRYCWWEVTVLLRKSAIYVVATWFPMSWAPGAHLTYLALIMTGAELIHGTIRPYKSPSLDRLEGQALGIASMGLLLVVALLVRWPFMPYAIYVTNCALLFILTAGAYLHFLFLYLRAMFKTDANEEEEDSSETWRHWQ